MSTFVPPAAGDDKSPLFRSAVRRTGTLAATAMHRVDAWRMVQRRAAELGMKVKIGCHTFRATGITAYLEAGGTLENAQLMAAHESPRTTKLYDRTGDEITLVDAFDRVVGDGVLIATLTTASPASGRRSRCASKTSNRRARAG
jgi:integrase